MGWGLFAALGGVASGVGLLLSSRHRVNQGNVVVINRMRGEPVVHFRDCIVWPFMQRAEVMDISLRMLEISCRGKDGLLCRDNIRADICVSVFLRVGRTQEDVLRVAQTIGCARASDDTVIEALFTAKLADALETVGKQLDFEDLYTRREELKDRIIAAIGADLGGFVLEDVAIESIEQTPIEKLDPNNVLDAKCILHITEITTERNIRAGALRQQEQREISRQNLEAAEALFESERRQAEAEAKHKREIAAMRAREEAEISKIVALSTGGETL